jgi:hypothetical protein
MTTANRCRSVGRYCQCAIYDVATMPERNETPLNKRRKVVWWKLGAGLILLPLAVADFLPGRSPELKPVNSGEAVGYYGAASLMLVAAVWLIVAGIQAIWPRPE